MSFSLNTNTYGLYAHARTSAVNDKLGESLEKLSSGLRINSAADDASGLAIANTLRLQSTSLGQSMQNANEAIGLAKIADNAMDEMANILNTIKAKSIQAAQDGQSSSTRDALQQDVKNLMDSYSKITEGTTYNGQALLNGAFVNKSFQVGASANQTIDLTIGSSRTTDLGHTRFESSFDITGDITAGATDEVQLVLTGIGENGSDFTFKNVLMGDSEGTGLGALTDEVNKWSDITGVRASWSNVVGADTAGTAIVAQAVAGAVTVNGVSLGNLTWEANDSSGSLVGAINSKTAETGVSASVDETGELRLNSIDGRAIHTTGLANADIADTSIATANVGTFTLISKDGTDINASTAGGTFDLLAGGTLAEQTLNLAQVVNGFSEAEANAAGYTQNVMGYDTTAATGTDGIGVGVDSLQGASMVMSIVDTALKDLDKTRGAIGSVQNQLTSQITNITVTQANIQIAESGIRDVDFGEESAMFNKNKLMAQAGTFAMSQANVVQQNIMKLLQ